MSTLDLPGLEVRLEALGLGPIPQFSHAHVLNNPLDIGRSYLADILGKFVGCDPTIAYNSIKSPKNIFNGDLAVPLPKLFRGSDWNAFRDVIKRVWLNFFFTLTVAPISLITILKVSKLSPFLLPLLRRSSSSDLLYAKRAHPSATPLYQRS
jgi:arginyl-tRNA synthetase